ncbi:MAG: glycosyltransferase, partial [Chitinophagales bacterium]
MKIAIFTNEFPPNIYGGAGVHVDFLSQELAKLGKVEVRCYGDQFEDHDNMHVRGVETTLMTPEMKDSQRDKMYMNLYRDVEMARATPQADIVHCHTWYTHLAG